MARARRASQFDYFNRWWRGDAVHAAFAKQVSNTLREAAFKTRDAARKRIIRRDFYSMKQMRSRKGTVRTKRQVDRKYKQLKSGRRRKYKPSSPGQSPTWQTNVLRGSILYDFRDQAGMIETYTGAISLPSSEHWSFTGGKASHALEWGGYSINHGGKQVYIAARPFMRPAAGEVLRSGILERSLRGSVRVDSRTSSYSAGWQRT